MKMLMKAMNDDGEEVPFEIDSYSEFKEAFEDRIREYFTKDEILDVIDDELQSSQRDIDIDVYDYEENFDIAHIKGGMEFYFRCNDDMNEKIAEAIEDETGISENDSNYIEEFMDELDEEGSSLGISVEKE